MTNSTHLKFILLVLWAFVKRPIIAEFPDIINTIKALYAVRDSVHLQHIYTFWDGSHCINLQICKWVSQRNTQWHQKENQ